MTWKILHHPNVLPLLGVIMIDKHFAMVSEWMVNGSINEFTKVYRGVNQFELVGFDSFLLDLLLTDEHYTYIAPGCC